MTDLDRLPNLLKVSEQTRDAANQVIQCIKDGVYCSLLGPRLSGKTGLLRFVQTVVAQNATTACVYMDLQRVEASTLARFFATLVRIVAHSVAEQTGCKLPVPATGSSVIFRRFLSDSVAQLKRDLVLMIDHLETVPNDLVKALLTSLRAAYMDQQSCERQLVAVVSGALSLATLAVGESSPFQGIARRVLVSDLARSECQALIDTCMASDSVQASPAARAWLLRAARGDPYLIATICNECIQIASQYPSRKVTASTVKRVMQEFMRDKASAYEPLREAVQLVEDDPDLLHCILLLLERNTVPKRKLPLPLSPDPDPLYLTGLVRRVNKDAYALRNEIYRRFLVQHFNPGRVGYVLTMAGQWDLAIDYLERSVRAGYEQYRTELMAAVINSMYAADDVKRTAYYLIRGLSTIFGIQEAYVYYFFPPRDVLTQVEQLRPTLEAAVPIARTISIDKDCLEARACREGHYLRRHQEDDRTVLAVPLSAPGQEPVGVVTIYNYLAGYKPAQQRERVMQLLGYLNQTARAVSEVMARESQTMRIHDQDVQLETKAHQLSLLHHISALVQTMADLEKMLNLVLTGITARHGLGFDRAWLFLFNGERTRLTGRMAMGDFSRAGAPYTEEHAGRIQFDEYVRYLLNDNDIEHTPIDMPTRELNLVASKRGDDLFSRVAFRRHALRWFALSPEQPALPCEFQRLFEPQEVIVVPLLAQGECLGIMVADDKFSPRAYTSADEEMLATFANQAAAAIVNARQRQQEQRQRRLAETLREVSAVIGASLELDEVLKLILEQMARVLPFDTASVQLLNASHTGLEIIACKGFDDPASVKAIVFPLEDVYPNARVWRTKKPLRYHRVREIFSQFAEPRYHATRVRDWLGTPLVVGDEAIGVITLDSFTPDLYTSEHEYLAMVFASQAAVAIKNARLFDSAQRRIRDLEIVNDIVQIISTKLDTQALLKAIVSQIADQLNCTHCTIFFLQKEKGELVLVPQVTHGVRREQIMTRRFKPSEGLAGWVSRHGESLVLRDAKQDPRFSPAREHQDRPRSMLVAPVKVGEQTIGVISADQDAFGWFSDSDRRLVDALARQAGIAIERATALELLHDVGKQITSEQEVDDILQHIVSGAIKLTNTTSGVIYLVSKDGKSMIKDYQHPPEFDHPQPRMAMKEGLTRQVVTTGEMMVFPDIRQDPRVNPVLHTRVHSMIAIPLKVDEQTVIGVLYLNDANPHSFTETEVSLLSTLATQAAIAIVNARLLQNTSEALEKRVAEMETLQEIDDAITSTLEFDKILKMILDRALELTEATCGTVHLVSESGQELVLVMAQGAAQASHGARLRMGEGVTGKAAQDGRAYRISDVRSPQWKHIYHTYIPDMQSELAVPMLFEGQVVGVINIESTDTNAFSEDDERLLTGLARQAAIAIQNARLFDSAQRRIRDLEIINDIVQIISTKLDTQDLFQAIVSQIAVQLNCAHCTLFFPHKDKDELVLVPQVTHGVRAEQIMTRRFKAGEGLVGWVFQHGQSLALSNVREDPRFSFARAHSNRPRSMLIAPVKVGDRTIGVISADQDEFGWFSESDRRLVDALARQAGIAIERAIALELMYDVGNQIISSQAVDDILQHIVSGAIKLTNTTSGVIHLVSEDGRSVIKSLQHPPDFDLPKPRMHREDSVTRQVVATGEMMIFPDIQQDARANPVLHGRVRSLIAVPLKLDERKVIGVLYLNDANPHSFTETEVSLLSTLATQAAIAIQNARQYEALHEAQDELLAAGAIAWMGLFGSEWSHTVAQKTFSIRNYVDVLKDVVTDDDPPIEQALDSIDVIAQEIQDVPLVIPSPADTKKGEPVLIDPLVRKLIEGWCESHDCVHLEMDLRCRDVWIRVDEPLLRMALQKLVDNALRHMPEGGTLKVESRIMPEGFAAIALQDTGSGIPNEYKSFFGRQRIPKSQIDSGSGMGALLARFILRKYDGDLTLIWSEKDRGTRLEITLPIYEQGPGSK